MAQEGQYQSPLELITHNVRSILADVLNKLECGDVDVEIDFREWQGISGPLVGETVDFLQVSKLFSWNVKFWTSSYAGFNHWRCTTCTVKIIVPVENGKELAVGLLVGEAVGFLLPPTQARNRAIQLCI